MFQVLKQFKHDVSRVSFERYLQTWGNMLPTFANLGPRSGLRLFWSLSVSLLFSLLRDSGFRKDRQIRQSHRIHFLNVHRFIKFLSHSTQGENLMFPPGCSPKFPRGLLRLISKKGEGTFSEVLKARDLARRHSWDGRTKHDFCAASWNFAWDTRSVASQNWLTDWNSERFTKLSRSAWWEHPQAQSIKSGKHVAIKCAYLSWWDGAWQRLCNGLVQWDGSEMSEAWRTTSTASTRWTTSGKSRCSMVQPARSHSSHSWAAGNWGQPAFPIISDNFRSIPGTDHWHAH